MEIRVDDLRVALTSLQPVVPKKPTLAILKNVLLKDGKVSATDLETAVTIDIPATGGKCLIPHRSVLELLKHIPGYSLLHIEAKRGVLTLNWEGGNASYDVESWEDYPPIPQLTPRVEGVLSGDSLIKALEEVVSYCAVKDERAVLTGVTLFLGEKIQTVGADGFRLATKSLPISFPSEETIIIPRDTVKVLTHLWKMMPPAPPPKATLIEQVTAKKELTLGLGKDMASVSFGVVTIVTKLITGTPPNYHRYLAAAEEDDIPQIRVYAQDLEQAVRRIKDVAKAGADAVRLSWCDASLNVAAKSEDKGKVEVTLSCQAETEGKVALNVSYLLDYLKGKEGLVTMAVKNDRASVLFRHSTSPLVLIMPLYVEW